MMGQITTWTTLQKRHHPLSKLFDTCGAIWIGKGCSFKKNYRMNIYIDNCIDEYHSTITILA
jgi:hypothetical protein